MTSPLDPDIVFVHTVPVPATGSGSLSPESEQPSRSFSPPASAEVPASAPAYASDEDDGSNSQGTPQMTHFHEFRDSDDSVTCKWESCGLVFTHLPTLIEHIHSEHIGVNKSNYTCEWTTCQRRGMPQTSRFALISHIRSHTGEKPFTCARPECDKSFTRSDALAKHMRLQHNISPPLPGRGGSRKRKRGPEDTEKDLNTPPPPPPPPVVTQSSFSSFKVEPNTPLDVEDPAAVQPSTSVINPRDFEPPPQPLLPRYGPNGGRLSPTSSGIRTPPRVLDSGGSEDDAPITIDSLPPYFRAHYAAADNKVMGRSPEMVMYILMKARHCYAVDQQEQLEAELNAVRAELQKERDAKEAALDRVLRGYFGAQAEHLIEPVPLPPSMLNAVAPVPMNHNFTSILNATTTFMANGNNYYRVRSEL